MVSDDNLSRLSRYEALFELSVEINASSEIAQAGQILASRLKYAADVYSWRYLCFEEAASNDDDAAVGIVVDGHRGAAQVEDTDTSQLCEVELNLWDARKARHLVGDELAYARSVLPAQFQRDDIAEVYVRPRISGDGLQSMFLFSKLREPFNDLDIKFLTLASLFFHDKAFRLWEGKKLRALEKAYVDREILLRDSEKLATLGRLSAGLAHELNNPAAASQRGAELLRTEIDRLADTQRRLGETQMTEEQRDSVSRLTSTTLELARQPSSLDPLAQSDLESELEAWLRDRGVPDEWDVAHSLATIGLDSATVAELTTGLDDHHLPLVVSSLSTTYATQALLEEISEGTRRISEIVRALKSYTYLDQGPVQAVDVHEGLDNTLVILRSRLKEGVVIRREYDRSLPAIHAHGSELNQVWTNIIDNAIAAMDGAGELSLRTYRDGDWYAVDIMDSGPGIDGEIQSRLFDPFFTTKPQGEGTGLGLSISRNIVERKHGGRIEVSSVPGRTVFSVRLPINHEDAGTAE
jgi:signal transduction histidine kinase